jgi:pyroglutamyl-peptidase
MTSRKNLPTALVTGFAPFAGEAINPSLEIARALDGKSIAGHRVVGAELPTEFATALPLLRKLIAKHRPVVVMALGLAGGRNDIAIERVAINLIDARIPDNAGAQPVDVRIVDNAANAYFSTLPVKSMLAALRAAGIPAALSLSAGTFVCNQVFFGLAQLLSERYPKIRGGFVHVPYLRQQAARYPAAPSMALATMIDGIELALKTALMTREDTRYAAGTTH